jgi:hypothetical protein
MGSLVGPVSFLWRSDSYLKVKTNQFWLVRSQSMLSARPKKVLDFVTEEKYRRMASYVRAEAERAADPYDRRALTLVAEQYDSFAQRAKRRAEESRTSEGDGELT